ncbi:hypothetical protein R4I43_28800 [Saccharopolyspora sp. S2-29]|uniref:Uncharacterized protein n=1 Tax=Saccharopolyspora mangrovi TaxID=3082379 RepID=A0ABU6AIN9_9PSEU|nr:hypothetical protein [Saccharopolyspora sp. S2-29]MEB3371410.1 hypothetical protein [Saccharopolyspora sp. S2-29]
MQHGFGEHDVRAQQLREVRVGLAQFHQQPEQLVQRQPGTAALLGQPQRADAGCAQPPHLLEGQPALPVSTGSGLGDAGEQRSEGGDRVVGLRDGCGHRMLLSRRARFRQPAR